MAFLSRLFKKEPAAKIPRGFHALTITGIERLTEDSVLVRIDVPEQLRETFSFKPGQYLNFAIPLNGEDHRRSYSICSAPGNELCVAVKAVENGTVSNWFNSEAKEGIEVLVAPPVGNFTLHEGEKNVVAFVAGSGITPVMSIARSLDSNYGKMRLFYGNKTVNSIIFREELEKLGHVTTVHYLSREEKAPMRNGRLDKQGITACIREDLTVLQADVFFLCGPEQMIMDARETLKLFGVADNKIRFELFTTPSAMPSNETETDLDFTGKSQVTVFLDDEKISFELDASGKTILETLDKKGYDAPYSCRGGVCCTCKAKVLEGNAKMALNYTLTDEEVEQGYILTCQSHPASEKLTITYDV